MTVMIVENCPSFTTNMKAAKRRILDVQSKIVLSNRNGRFPIARFLKRDALMFICLYVNYINYQT